MPRAVPATALLLLAMAPPALGGGGQALDHLEALRTPAGLTPPQERAVREWRVLGLAGGGRDPSAAVPGRRPAADHLGPPPRAAPIGLARWVLAATASRRVRVAERRATRRRLEAAVRPGTGPLTLAWAVLGLRALGRPPADPALTRAAALLREAQAPDGGWSSGTAGRTDTPATGAALQALVALGVPRGDAALERGRAWLLATRRRDGGLPPVPGRASTGLDTAWAALAVWALGESPAAAPWTAGGRGPLDRLRALQGRDGGVADLPRGKASPVVTSVAARAFRAAPLPGTAPPRGARVDPAPVVVRRRPAPGQAPRRAVVVLYRDDPGGTGVDPTRVRLVVGERDVTGRARVTPFSVQVPADALGALPAAARLTLADRAGNVRVVTWVIGGRAQPQERASADRWSTR